MTRRISTSSSRLRNGGDAQKIPNVINTARDLVLVPIISFSVWYRHAIRGSHVTHNTAVENP